MQEDDAGNVTGQGAVDIVDASGSLDIGKDGQKSNDLTIAPEEMAPSVGLGVDGFISTGFAAPHVYEAHNPLNLFIGPFYGRDAV